MPYRRKKIDGTLSAQNFRKAFKPSILLRVVVAIVAAWVCALITAAAGLPLLAVVVLALMVSAGVFRLLEKSEAPK